MRLISNDDLLKKMGELETKLDRLIYKDNIEEFEEFTEHQVHEMTGWPMGRVRMYCETGALKARKEIGKRAGKKIVKYYIKRCQLREFQEPKEPEIKRLRLVPDGESTEQMFKKAFGLAR